MIGIIDYGMGNLGSVSNACRFLGLPFSILSKPDEMSGCQAVILPGVGAFGDCMSHLAKHGFTTAVRDWIDAGKPFLGICLGLQVLYEGSEESPGVAGLGILPGVARRFVLPPEWKIPQIGWNRVRQVRRECPLFEQVPDGAFFYFVHSYYTESVGAPEEAGLTAYGTEYTSVVWRDNVLAVQFHPEKSQKTGLQMLRNFGRWAGRR
ncbi:MAG: imidazole glycerol phosphate synthase subunit HisH [Verrucomicrobia bacterium]|nr:imidazole glycerol phosphate synthase subunit HisH [Verrucomicrobiota bacterium]